MTAPPPNPLDDHFTRAASWAEDRNEMRQASHRTAWRIAIATTVIAVCEGLALMALAPIKSVQPYTLLVDRQTGFVEALKPLETQSITADAALTRSFLVQYVIAREGFAIDALQSDYRKVGLWSAGEARSQYVTSMQAGNPDSPLARYPRSTTIDVMVKSVTSLSPSSAQVRFETRRTVAGGQSSAPVPWVALVRFGYSGEPMSVADRMINPLGFKVERYRRSAEAIPADYDPGWQRPVPPSSGVELAPGTVAIVPSGQAVVVRRLPAPSATGNEAASITARR